MTHRPHFRIPRWRLRIALTTLALLLVFPAGAHFTVDSVDRYLLVDRRDGRLVVLARIPLPFLLSETLANDAADSPVLGFDGQTLLLRPDRIAAHEEHFTGLIVDAHQWRVGGEIVAPEVTRWRVGLMSQEARMPFGTQADRILTLPSQSGPVPVGQALVDAELDLGPARPGAVTVRYALPPLQLPAGFSISNNLWDLTATPPVERVVPGQMTRPETVLLPLSDQLRIGLRAGATQALAGLGAAAMAVGLLAGMLRGRGAGWAVAGFAGGLAAAVIALPDAPLGAVQTVLPGVAVLVVALWGALALTGRAGAGVTVGAAALIGAMSGIEGIAELADLARRIAVRWSFVAGSLGLVLLAAGAGIAAARLPARIHRAAAVLTVVAAALFAGIQTVRDVNARAMADLDPLLQLPAEAAVAESFAFVSAALAELHRALRTGPDAVARLTSGDPADVLGPAAARLRETGLPPTEPDLHEVALKTFQMRRTGNTLRIDADWQVLGLKAEGTHEHVTGNRYAAEIVLTRDWGRWRFERVTLKPGTDAPG